MGSSASGESLPGRERASWASFPGKRRSRDVVRKSLLPGLSRSAGCKCGADGPLCPLSPLDLAPGVPPNRRPRFLCTPSGQSGRWVMVDPKAPSSHIALGMIIWGETRRKQLRGIWLHFLYSKSLQPPARLGRSEAQVAAASRLLQRRMAWKVPPKGDRWPLTCGGGGCAAHGPDDNFL